MVQTIMSYTWAYMYIYIYLPPSTYLMAFNYIIRKPQNNFQKPNSLFQAVSNHFLSSENHFFGPSFERSNRVVKLTRTARFWLVEGFLSCRAIDQKVHPVATAFQASFDHRLKKRLEILLGNPLSIYIYI